MKAQLEGAQDCREAMAEFSRTVQRNVGKRALVKAAAIIADAAKSRAPVSARPSDPTKGSLKASVEVVPAKSKVGAAAAVLIADPAAVPMEYGRTNQPARPFFRPAIQASEGAALAAFEAALTVEVEAAATKAAKRAAKAK